MESGSISRHRGRNTKDPGTEDSDEQDGDEDTDCNGRQRDEKEGGEPGDDELVGGSNGDEPDFWRRPQDKAWYVDEGYDGYDSGMWDTEVSCTMEVEVDKVEQQL